MPSRKAGASKGLDRALEAEGSCGGSVLPSRCICRGTAITYVYAPMLEDSVVLVIGTCGRHAPENDDEALALVRALLAGIAGLGRESLKAGVRRNRGVRS